MITALDDYMVVHTIAIEELLKRNVGAEQVEKWHGADDTISDMQTSPTAVMARYDSILGARWPSHCLVVFAEVGQRAAGRRRHGPLAPPLAPWRRCGRRRCCSARCR